MLLLDAALEMTAETVEEPLKNAGSLELAMSERSSLVEDDDVEVLEVSSALVELAADVLVALEVADVEAVEDAALVSSALTNAGTTFKQTRPITSMKANADVKCFMADVYLIIPFPDTHSAAEAERVSENRHSCFRKSP